jgi:hypothetical protein
VTLALFLTGLALAGPPTPKSTVESFYRAYLPTLSSPKAKPPKLAHSRSLLELIRRNDEVCREKAGTDVCGWGADGDVYLDAQEYDPKLTYKKSGAIVTEESPGKVRIRLNVYPSLKNAGKAYERDILFVLIREGGVWVVDDIVYGGSPDSARKQIQKEIEAYDR